MGTRASDNLVMLKPAPQRLEAFDVHLHQEHHQAIKHGGQPVFHKRSITDTGDQETYDSYCHTPHLHNFGKPRLVINQCQAEFSDAATDFISHQLQWQAGGITRSRRQRWPVDVSHEEGKAAGLDP